MMKKTDDFPPFVIDERSNYIDFETDDGSIIRNGGSYICLRRTRMENIGSANETIYLFFDMGIGEIHGDHLLLLYDEIKAHRISVVRKGISGKPDQPNIKRVKFTGSDEAGFSEKK